MADDLSPLPADLAALVGSRLCHDLISPLGAIGNGLELLSLPGVAAPAAGSSPELQLIAESVASATARLRVYRVAFGQAGAQQRLGRPEILALLDDLALGGRLQYAWQVPDDQPRAEVKPVFLALLCLEAALPWGGTVSVTRPGRNWQLQATAMRTRAEPDLWAQLDGAPGKVTAAQVQFALLAQELMRLGRSAVWQVTETGAAIAF
jgi:histidine phosphotransferase ChpT